MTNRRTPCVDGWCGPMLRTISSSVGFAKTISLIGALRLALLDGEEIDRVRPERGNAVVVVLLREVLSQGMAFPVVGQEHTPQVGVAFEDDAEEIVALALVVPGGLPEVRERLDRRIFPIWHHGSIASAGKSNTASPCSDFSRSKMSAWVMVEGDPPDLRDAVPLLQV